MAPQSAVSVTDPRASARSPWAHLLAEGRPLVMGVLNITPDSFSDGGRYIDPQDARAQARHLVEAGADILDIGAESTRPYGGAVPVSAEDELARLSPVLPAAVALGVPVSIDTLKAQVAAWAVAQGAAMINDVWGLQRDPDMARVAADAGVPVCLMHNREAADTDIDIMADVRDFLARSIEIALRAGVSRDNIVIDPGIGFGKTPQQSVLVLSRLRDLHDFGFPLLVGVSRKRFIDHLSPAPPDRRIGGSIAANVLAVLDGARIVRVHDVAETVQAIAVTRAIRSAT